MKLNIGQTIKRFRKERDITQEEFAEIIGVSCQSVSRWENDNCYPDIELIPTIAAFFGISTDKLMGIDEITEKVAQNIYDYFHGKQFLFDHRPFSIHQDPFRFWIILNNFQLKQSYDVNIPSLSF